MDRSLDIVIAPIATVAAGSSSLKSSQGFRPLAENTIGPGRFSHKTQHFGGEVQ
jgi:hypothetical protein